MLRFVIMDAGISVLLVFILLIVMLPFVAFGIVYVYLGIRYRVPYVPSSNRSIEKMLAHAGLLQGVTVLDLGSGTGDIILAAAERGAQAIGIEINPFLVWITRWRIARAGFRDRATVIRGDIFKTRLPPADVVMLYLPSVTSARLCAKLTAELPPHARIISLGYSFPGWTPVFVGPDIKVYVRPDTKKVPVA